MGRLNGKCSHMTLRNLVFKLTLLIILTYGLSYVFYKIKGEYSAKVMNHNSRSLHTTKNGKVSEMESILRDMIKEISEKCNCNSTKQTSMENSSTQVVTKMSSGAWDDSNTSEIESSRADQNISKCSPVVPRLSEKPLPVTGLVSYPGSGNTWVRHLMQEVTGIGTSSLYCDEELRDSTFPFECLGASNRTIAVKWHGHWKKRFELFERAILLIRNPYATLLAFFNYDRGGGHVGFAKADFGNEWTKFVHEQIQVWQKVNSQVIQNFTKPLYVLFYENLLTELQQELRKMSQFLNIAVNDTVLDCTFFHQEGRFHRVRKPVQVKELFTNEMIRNITIATDKVSDVLEARFGVRLNNSVPERL